MNFKCWLFDTSSQPSINFINQPQRKRGSSKKKKANGDSASPTVPYLPELIPKSLATMTYEMHCFHRTDRVLVSCLSVRYEM
ncbi:hypothetical protein EYC84_010136 [Monilinia fructicola]|uniref:Uncharacterized protein n=1 Tax=Monilinia fructicola TaxID=38448 RepID=A0A5M9JBS7_MONFR|nr:hypothetical protein EYC84_010136 [Monilinia fructicola]